MRKIEDLLKSQQELISKRKNGENLIKAVVNYTGYNTDPIINRVLSERVVIDETLKKISEAISSIQDLCKHEMVYEYHDGHYNYYTCNKCNKTDKV